jgi:chemotaxis signal transduction protein
MNFFEEIDMADIKGVLVFELNEIEFCIDIGRFWGIINPQKSKNGALTLNHDTGLLSYNDEIIRFFDLKEMMGMDSGIPSNNAEIVVVNLNDGKAAFYADRISEVILLDENIKTNSKLLPAFFSEGIKYSLLVEGRTLLMPSLESLNNLLIY